MFSIFKKRNTSVVTSPISGIIIPLEEVKDPVFSTGMMGKGCAISPSENTVCSPIDGELVLVADTGHAFGIRTADKNEILIHIGLDTVNLKGRGFQILQHTGDKVKAGTPVIHFDKEYLKDPALDMTTMIIVTSPSGKEIDNIATGVIHHQEQLFVL